MSVTLADIQFHHIAIMCLCSHSSTLSVADLLETYPPETTYGTIKKNARCTKCGRKGNVAIRIIYVGGSLTAMRGSGNQ